MRGSYGKKVLIEGRNGKGKNKGKDSPRKREVKNFWKDLKGFREGGKRF